jgi:hypothetical protein
MHTIGKGESAGKALCAVMNLPKGPTGFQKCSKILSEAVKDCSGVNGGCYEGSCLSAMKELQILQ